MSSNEMKIPARLQLGLALVVIHLSLVAFGISEIEFDSKKPLGKAFAVYGDLTGASAGYGFFSPGVESQLRAQFDVTKADKSTRTIQLEEGMNSEAFIRTGDIIEKYYQAFDEEDSDDMQRDLSASLAASVFGRFPTATDVRVRIDEFSTVSMNDYREGKRPEWKNLYTAHFSKKPIARSK